VYRARFAELTALKGEIAGLVHGIKAQRGSLLSAFEKSQQQQQ
jgi:hypothetical protein